MIIRKSWKTVKKDGFYIGETTDGRRGLVPGNYLELVPNLNAPPYRMRDQLNAHHQAMPQAHPTGPSPQAIDHLHHQRNHGTSLV